MIDLTLRCPVCGQRADMCFRHGDDWKKRPAGRTESYSERLRREGGMVASGKFSPATRPIREAREPRDLVADDGERAAVTEADGDLITVGRIDDLADDLTESVVVEGDPAAGAMLHTPKSDEPWWPLTPLCGICGQTVGCECGGAA